MTRVGVTQRVSVVEEYGERRDCLDQRWTDLLADLGFEPVALPNKVRPVAEYVGGLEIEALVLTGGNDVGGAPGATDVAPERDTFEHALVDLALEADLPLVGVCRGLQLLNVHLGGSIRPVGGHVDVTHEVDVRGVEPLGETLSVNSYHTYGFDEAETADPLAPAGLAPDGTVEVAVHESAPICGVMWHPERGDLGEGTRRLLRTYLGGATP